MVDFEKIGKRIFEERKYLHKISQEKMAEDLGMYQADISNLEKAKNGSGITDLSKLDMIADYFGMPLETLLFGREDKNMLKYEGSKMQLKFTKRKLIKSQKETLDKIMGMNTKEAPMIKLECGPYLIVTVTGTLIGTNEAFRDKDGELHPNVILQKHQTFVFLGTELIAAMSADRTTVMQHIFIPALQQLKESIPFQVLDVTDVWRTLNPHGALYNFTVEENEEAHEFQEKMVKRMDDLRDTGEDRPVLYVESIFVREDCRRNGICRLYFDAIKMLCEDDPVIWVNMEPTSGRELDREKDLIPSYTIADIGQLNLNAVIAEHLGFTVDPDTWHRESEVIDPVGNKSIKTVLVRKCAYYIPEAIREVIKNDGDLVALGRARQKMVQAAMKDENVSSCTMDIRKGVSDGFRIYEVKETVNGAVTYIYSAVSEEKEETYRFGVSKKSPIDYGVDHEDQIEKYEFLDDALDSEYYEDFVNYMMILSLKKQTEE